ncbi:MAG: hypothetical protein ACREQK_11845 [Candidatus Binatia bacterium]
MPIIAVGEINRRVSLLELFLALCPDFEMPSLSIADVSVARTDGIIHNFHRAQAEAELLQS